MSRWTEQYIMEEVRKEISEKQVRGAEETSFKLGLSRTELCVFGSINELVSEVVMTRVTSHLQAHGARLPIAWPSILYARHRDEGTVRGDDGRGERRQEGIHAA